jgi:small-conductance mechanosensitive channel
MIQLEDPLPTAGLLEAVPLPDWPVLARSFAGVTLAHWALAALAGAVAVFVLLAVRAVVVRRLQSIATRTVTPVDDVIAEALGKTSAPFLVVVGAWFAVRLAGPDARLVSGADGFAFVVLLLQAMRWGNTLVRSGFRAYTEREELDGAAMTSVQGVSFLARLVLGVLLLLVGLDHFGVNITALVTGLGIGGIAVALAVQNILGDLFASLSIVLDKPFVVGDFVVINEFMGKVESIGLKTTRIRSLSGEQIVFSNGDLLSSRLRNFQRLQERRVVLRLGVTYQTPRALLEKIPGTLREIVESAEDTRFDRAHMAAYGDFAILFELVYYALTPDFARHMDIQQGIFLRIHEAFERDGIEFAYPTQTLHLVRTAGGGDDHAIERSDRTGS